MTTLEPPERPARWGTPRTIERRTLGGAFDAVASVLGVMLFTWQRELANVALEIDPLTRALRYRTVGVSVARQNGKTLLVVIRVALEMIRPKRTVIYTAQDRNYARRQWEKHCDLLVSIPAFKQEVADYVKAHGSETLKLKNGSQYIIVTPNEDAARSLTVDLAVIDEAYAQRSMAVTGGISPTMITRPSAQLWVLSNAGTFTSVLFRHYTQVGRAAVEDDRSRMAWFEWAADLDADLLDRDSWADANPSMGLRGGPLADALEDELLKSGEDTFRREHLNQWLDLGALAGVDAVAWAACFDPTPPPKQVCLALDITPERDYGALVAAGDIGGGRLAFEVIEHTSDLQRLVVQTAEVAARQHADVVIDRASPAGACIPLLERLNVNVRLIGVPDLQRGSGGFQDAVIAGLVAHPADGRLTDAVLGASKRRVGDGWVWDRRAGVDITPLNAATLARWGILTKPPADPKIYVARPGL